MVLHGFPELHGPAVKAANTRALTPYAVNLQQRLTTENPSDLNKHALKVIESLQACYNMFYGAGYFLPPAEIERLDFLLSRLGRNYQVLSVQTSAAGLAAWKQTPKLHYAVAHLSAQAALINPRFTQTYGSEGLVGKVAAIYRMSQNGPFRAGVQRKILLKYRTGMALDFL